MRQGLGWILSKPAFGRTARLLGLALAIAIGWGVAFAIRSSVVAVLPPPRPLAGPQPYATLLCKFSDEPAEPLSIGYFDRLFFEGPDSMDRYWRRVSGGAINLSGSKAFGWFAMAHPAARYLRSGPIGVDLEQLARDCASAADAQVSFRAFSGINLVFNKCIARPRGGEMALLLDGELRRYRLTWLCPGRSVAHQIVAHEMGHSFGLTHSAGAGGDEYGNAWDVMSVAGQCAPASRFGALAQQPIAINKDLLGWIPPERKVRLVAEHRATIRLNAPEQEGDGYLLAQIPLSGGRLYTVEARTRYGFDAALPASGVLIHEFDPHREHKARLVSPLRGVVSGDSAGLFGGWGVGATFHDPTSGVTVRVEHQTTSGFVVTVDQSDFAFDGPDGALRMAVARAAAARSEAGIFCAEISRN